MKGMQTYGLTSDEEMRKVDRAQLASNLQLLRYAARSGFNTPYKQCEDVSESIATARERARDLGMGDRVEKYLSRIQQESEAKGH